MSSLLLGGMDLVLFYTLVIPISSEATQTIHYLPIVKAIQHHFIVRVIHHPSIVRVIHYLPIVRVIHCLSTVRAGNNLPTARTAMSPGLALGSAPLQSLGIMFCGAAVVEVPKTGKWEDTGLT